MKNTLLVLMYVFLLLWSALYAAVSFLILPQLSIEEKLINFGVFGLGLLVIPFIFGQIRERNWKSYFLQYISRLDTNTPQPITANEDDTLHQALEKLSTTLQTATLALKALEEGNEINLPQLQTDSHLHQSLHTFVKSYQKQQTDNYQIQWHRQGYAQLNDLLRKSSQESPQKLAQLFLESLARYLDVQQGAIYWIENQPTNSTAMLQLAAAYACPAEMIHQKTFDQKEGLLGECFTKAKPIFINHLPENFPSLQTGLERLKPASLALYPLLKEQEKLGVLEVIAYHTLEDYQHEFVVAICENYALTLDSQRMYQNTKSLLQSAQNANMQLKEREAQMSQYSEELEKMQLQLSDRLQVIEQETNLLHNILEAIDKTNATIEFDMEGVITDVNDMYLSVVGYQREELIGRHESVLVPKEDLTSGRYDMIWQSLKEGAYLSGEYKRNTKQGREVWLESTYNPIFDTEGNPFKVIQLAQFTTEDKEKDFEQTSKLNALGQTLPIIELNQEGQIIRINPKFTEILGYERKDTRRKLFTELIDQEDASQQQFAAIWKEVWQGKAQSSLLRLLDIKERIHQILVYLNPIMKLDGHVDKILVTLIDLSEIEGMRKRLQNKEQELSKTIEQLHQTSNQLRLQNQEFDTVVKMFNQACKAFELDEDFNFIYLNENLQKKLGLKKDQLPQIFEQLIDPRFPKTHWQASKKQLQDVHLHHFTIKYKAENGTSFWGNTTITAYKDFDKNALRYLGIIIDVTDEVVQAVYLRGEIVELKMKNAILAYQNIDNNTEIQEHGVLQTALAATPEKLENMIQHQLLPSIALNRQGIITEANSLVYDLLGYPKNTLEGKLLTDLLSFKNVDEAAAYQHQLSQPNGKQKGIKVINNQKGNGLYANTALIPNPQGLWFLFVIL